MNQSELVYFHVSRASTGGFTEGQSLNADCHTHLGPLPDEARDLLNHYFGGSLSRHGAGYLGLREPDASLVRELIWEMVRREFFPQHPSRFQSFFAFPNCSDALTFARNCATRDLKVGGVVTYEMWRVRPATEPFVGDMNLLNGGHNWLEIFGMAKRYWQGDRSDRPLLEVLLPLPVTMVERVGKVVCRKFIDDDGNETTGTTLVTT